MARHTTKPPSMRRVSALTTFSLQLISFMSDEIVARELPFAAKYICRCDATLPSLLLQYCGCTCVDVGGTSYCFSDRSNDRGAAGVDYRSRRWSKRQVALDAVPRGGSTTEEPLHPDPADDSSAPHRVVSLTSLPLIDAASASLALRLTCETNLRLHCGTSSGGGRSSAAAVAAVSATTTEDSRTLQPHQNGIHSHQLHSQQHAVSIPPPIRTISEEELSKERREEEWTAFHAKEMWEPATDAVNATHSKDTESGHSTNQRRGTLRWGPDLESYIDSLLSAVVSSGGSDSSKQSSPMEDETQIVLALTILYLDRSTSFETPLHIDPQTGRPWFPPCPHLVPRTVHRMVLTATAIAAKCVRGENDVSNLLREAANAMLGEKCAISEKDLEQMENWMLHALGGAAGAHHSHPHHDVSWQVSHDEAGTFLRKWAQTFYPTRLKAHDESRRKQLERFWREQTTATFGTSHGHGNYWPEGRSGGGAHQHGASLQYSSMEQTTESHPELRGHQPQPHYYQPPASEHQF